MLYYELAIMVDGHFFHSDNERHMRRNGVEESKRTALKQHDDEYQSFQRTFPHDLGH